MLEQDADEALERAVKRAVNHIRRVLMVVGAHVRATETRRLLPVELDRSHLPGATERVVHEEVDLRPIEGAFPFCDAVTKADSLERPPQDALGVIPLLVGAELVVGSRGELCVSELAHSERVVEEVDVVEHRVDLLLDLVLHTEDVGIVLAELPGTSQPLQTAGWFVAVEDGGFGEANR